jgi:hypothetical protein
MKSARSPKLAGVATGQPAEFKELIRDNLSHKSGPGRPSEH